jgi:hypothetical protein
MNADENMPDLPQGNPHAWLPRPRHHRLRARHAQASGGHVEKHRLH